MYILNNPARLAKLLASLNVPNNLNRPLSPMDVAREIKTLQKDLNNDQNELVKRLPIEQDMTKQFLSLLRLPPQVQDMVVWGESKKETGALGFSVAARIAMFDEPQDVLKLVGTVTEMSRPITKEEVKGMLSMEKTQPRHHHRGVHLGDPRRNPPRHHNPSHICKRPESRHCTGTKEIISEIKSERSPIRSRRATQNISRGICGECKDLCRLCPSVANRRGHGLYNQIFKIAWHPATKRTESHV